MSKASTCAICDSPLGDGAAKSSSLYPFCSKRCKLIDLNRWFGGEYMVVSKNNLQDETDELDEVEIDALIAKLEAGE